MRACISKILLPCAIIAVSAMNAGASPLNLTKTNPDVFTDFITVDYDTSSGQFNASGYPLTLTFDSSNIQNISNSAFSLSMLVDSSGNLQSGSVTFTGDTDGPPVYSGTLLTGAITQFGFLGPIFEFVFNVDSSSLLKSYFPSGSGGIIVSFATDPGPNWYSSSFSDDSWTVVADTFPFASTPEPSSLILLSFVFMPAAWQLRRGRCKV